MVEGLTARVGAALQHPTHEQGRGKERDLHSAMLLLSHCGLLLVIGKKRRLNRTLVEPKEERRKVVGAG